MRSECGHAALEIAVERPRQAPPESAARPRSGADTLEAELVRRARRRTAPAREHFQPGAHERRAQLGDALGPRLERIARRVASGRAAQRRVALRNGRAVLRRQRGASRRKPAENTVEVRAPRSRRALHDAEPVGREDERRRLRAELLGRAQRGAVQPSRACRRPTRPSTSISTGTVAATAPNRGSRALLAEADQLRVVARPRREALRPDVHASSRFVLPTPFGPTASTSPGRSSSSSRSYDRKLRSETASTIRPVNPAGESA